MKKNNVEIIDVRDKQEFENEHIPGAKSIPLNELENYYKDLSKDSSVVIVCNRGGQKSQKAFEFLKGKGYKNAEILDGGMVAWKEKESQA